MKQAGVVGPGHLGCHVRGGRDCKIERWGDSGILLGTGAGDSGAEATSPPEGRLDWGLRNQLMGPVLWGRPSVMSSQV